MIYKLSFCIVFGLALSFSCAAQSLEPEVIAIAVTSENGGRQQDTTDYEVRIDLNSLHDLKKIQIHLGSSEKAKDVVSLKGEIYRKDKRTYLQVGNRSFAFNRYSVSIPVKLSKKDAGKWKFFFAASEDARGKVSKERVFPKNK